MRAPTRATLPASPSCGCRARSSGHGCSSWPAARSARAAPTSSTSRATWRTPERAAGRSRRRSTTTSRRPSSRSPCRLASGRARTIPTAPRSSPRSGTSSAGTKSRPSRASMAATPPKTRTRPGKGPAAPADPSTADPIEAPSDQPLPAQPSPRAKDAPRTMRVLRRSRERKRPSRSRPVENVLREGLRLERVPDPSMLVLFGATGDLAHRKVIPALYQLWRTNLLPHEFAIVAIGRRDYDDESFRADLRASAEKYSRVLPLDEAAWRSFATRIRYQRCDFADAAGFDSLLNTLEGVALEQRSCGTPLY